MYKFIVMLESYTLYLGISLTPSDGLRLVRLGLDMVGFVCSGDSLVYMPHYLYL